MNISMHRLCSVVTHYIQHVSAIFFFYKFYKPVFIIDCTSEHADKSFRGIKSYFCPYLVSFACVDGFVPSVVTLVD